MYCSLPERINFDYFKFGKSSLLMIGLARGEGEGQRDWQVYLLCACGVCTQARECVFGARGVLRKIRFTF